MKKFDNFISHLEVLRQAENQDRSNEFIISGIIDKFAIQFELGWKVLKELLIYEGVAAGKTGSPREIIKAAYKCFDFMDEKVWLSMLKERNNTAHIYDGEEAKKLAERVIADYIPAFISMKDSICEKYGDMHEIDSMK